MSSEAYGVASSCQTNDVIFVCREIILTSSIVLCNSSPSLNPFISDLDYVNLTTHADVSPDVVVGCRAVR